MRMSNYFWSKLEVAVVYKRIGVAIELNVYVLLMMQFLSSVAFESHIDGSRAVIVEPPYMRVTTA